MLHSPLSSERLVVPIAPNFLCCCDWQVIDWAGASSTLVAQLLTALQAHLRSSPKTAVDKPQVPVLLEALKRGASMQSIRIRLAALVTLELLMDTHPNLGAWGALGSCRTRDTHVWHAFHTRDAHVTQPRASQSCAARVTLCAHSALMSRVVVCGDVSFCGAHDGHHAADSASHCDVAVRDVGDARRISGAGPARRVWSFIPCQLRPC